MKDTPSFIYVLGRAAGAGCSGEQDGAHPFFQGASAVVRESGSVGIHSQHRESV